MAKAAADFDERISNTPIVQGGGSDPNFPPCYIVNVGQEEWHIARTHGNYTIPARGTKRFAVLKIEQRRDVNDMGDSRKTPMWIDGKEIALDLVNELGTRFGLFVCSGPNPSDKDLKEAERELVAYLKTLVADANNLWARTRNSNLISDMQRRAAKELGLTFDWAFEPTQMADCPGCGEKIKPGVAVCRGCGAVLDKKKAEELGLVERSKKAANTE